MPRAYIFYQIPPLPTADAELFKLLNDNTQGDPFIAATENSFDGAVIQLSTGRAALALGGFDGHNEIVNKAKVEELIKQNKVRYFLDWQSSDIDVTSDITKWAIERSHKCNVKSDWSLYAFEGTKCPK
ncbi:hypothetical protein IPM44_04475 [bacterium]|nr:MAG: hypothetical protein IPM44_04475 [bacterium]